MEGSVQGVVSASFLSSCSLASYASRKVLPSDKCPTCNGHPQVFADLHVHDSSGICRQRNSSSVPNGTAWSPNCSDVATAASARATQAGRGLGHLHRRNAAGVEQRRLVEQVVAGLGLGAQAQFGKRQRHGTLACRFAVHAYGFPRR
jgi:hypothetical protein